MSVEQYLALVKKHYGDGVMGDLLSALSGDLLFTKKFVLNEHHLYGSSRLGVKTHKRVLLRKEFSISGFEETGEIIVDEVTDSLVYVRSEVYFYRVLAQKQYEMSNHLGNVLATVLDRRTGVFDEGADTLMYYVADVVSATLYYPFGMSMEGYSNVEFYYSFGFNTQEKVDEISLGHYTAEFWEYDSRTGKRWNTDPVVDESESPYATNKNNPIKNSDPNGDCATCPKPEFNAGLKLNITFGKNGGANLSLFAGASFKTGFATTGLNLSGTFYGGGVGTSSSSPTLFTGAVSPSLTFGFGSGTSRPLNTFNSFSGTGVNTSYSNSVSFGQNFTFSSGKTSLAGYGRNQRTSYFGITALNSFSAGHYNDVQRLPFWGDGGDEFWSAGLNASLSYKGFSASWTNDMYYGKSNHLNDYKKDIWINGTNYDDQPAYDMSLNNALETFNFTMPGSMFGGTQITLGMGRTGRAAMWPSNKMHNTIHPKNEDGTLDKSHHFHHLYVPNPTSTVFRFGMQR